MLRVRESIETYELNEYHRRLIYLGSPNWIAMFTLIGFISLYCARYVIYPRCKKLHHYVTKRRVEGTLDQIDGLEFEEMIERTCPRIDPETGELYMGTGMPEKINETEAMFRMLRDIKREEEEKTAAELAAREEEQVIGPDGKPMLVAVEFDAYGNLRESKKESKEEAGSSKRPNSAAAKKKGKKKPEQRKLSPKKLAAIEQKRKADESFKQAYKLSQTIPDIADRVTIVKEEFEKFMLHGSEPLGYQLSLAKRKELEANTDRSTFHLLPPSNYFHKLVEKEAIEETRYKYRKVKLARPKSAHASVLPPAVSAVYQFGTGRNEMGFDGKQRKPEGPPKKSEGKRLEDGDARDKSVIVRGFGSLPTRGGILDPRERRAKRETVEGRTEYFSKDGSGRPASPEEVREYKEEKIIASNRGRGMSSPERGKEAEGVGGRSMSPAARSTSPTERGSPTPPRPRPMTAAQFRRSYY